MLENKFQSAAYNINEWFQGDIFIIGRELGCHSTDETIEH